MNDPLLKLYSQVISVAHGFTRKNTKLFKDTTLKRKKMIKSVTRTLYIDGKPIAAYTQDPMADSELADIEQIAARMESLERPKKTQGSADVGNNAGNLRRLVRKGRPKALQLKLKLLQAVSVLGERGLKGFNATTSCCPRPTHSGLSTSPAHSGTASATGRRPTTR